DLSLWDVFKEPVDPAHAGKPLIDHFTDLPRGSTRLGVAGKILSGGAAAACLERGADCVLIGRAGILHHDFPRRLQHDPQFESVERPVTRAYLQAQGLGSAFIDYMATGWKGFVAG